MLDHDVVWCLTKFFCENVTASVALFYICWQCHEIILMRRQTWVPCSSAADGWNDDNGRWGVATREGTLCGWTWNYGAYGSGKPAPWIGKLGGLYKAGYNFKPLRMQWQLTKKYRRLQHNILVKHVLATTCGTQEQQHRGVSEHNNTYYHPSPAHLKMQWFIAFFSFSFFFNC